MSAIRVEKRLIVVVSSLPAQLPTASAPSLITVRPQPLHSSICTPTTCILSIIAYSQDPIVSMTVMAHTLRKSHSPPPLRIAEVVRYYVVRRGICQFLCIRRKPPHQGAEAISNETIGTTYSPSSFMEASIVGVSSMTAGRIRMP
jgi:hypothetical protein